MKINTKNLILISALAGLGLIFEGSAMAQTFTTVHSFSKLPDAPSLEPLFPGFAGTNADGAVPFAGVVLSGNILYGTATTGGSAKNGGLFRVNTDGSGFTNLYSFKGGSDQGVPRASLVLSGNTLYGTTLLGSGTVFAIQTDGSGYKILYPSATSGPSILAPLGGLTLGGNTLYGTSTQGGTSGIGYVFGVNMDGTGFTNLHSFAGGAGGGNPNTTLVFADGVLYGTGEIGLGSYVGDGTLFSLATNGMDFTSLYNFTGSVVTNPPEPQAVLLSGKTLYGTTYEGGSSSNGSVFAIQLDGTGFTNLYSFSGGSDGARPNGPLIRSGTALCGSARAGGANGNGTVFSLNTDGTGFSVLHTFSATNGIFRTNSDGAAPRGGLTFSGNTLYGTASYGGVFGSGTVFSLTLPSATAPQLTIATAGTNLVLAWPVTASGLTLQCTTNLGPSVVWTTVSSSAISANGYNIVTNPMSNSRMFYQLAR